MSVRDYQAERELSAKKREAGILINTPSHPVWKGGPIIRRRKQIAFAKIVDTVYEGVYRTIGIELTDNGPRLNGTNKKTRRKPTKIQLVALKRIAQKLYADALIADQIIFKEQLNGRDCIGNKLP